MNALYVTVSIPLLLLLVGFNHAHGLSTFGKSQNQNAQNTPQQPLVQGKPCTTQANCALIKSTTCLKGFCLCGDNSYPINGLCKAKLKGPRHLCTNDDECVDGADCLLPNEKNRTINSGTVLPVNGGSEKFCNCQEGLFEVPPGMCGGRSNFVVLPGLLMIIAIISRTLN